jgi:muramoyltetrapeptide carboxypeptidase
VNRAPRLPARLQPGDQVRIVAPSKTASSIQRPWEDIARARLEDELGLRLTFGAHVFDEPDLSASTPSAARLEDLHAAFADPDVAGILTVIGGFNANQVLDGLDTGLIRAHPKVLCGFSDITALQVALLAAADLVTYSGPHWSTFGMRDHFDDTMRWFRACLFDGAPFDLEPAAAWTDDAWYENQDARDPQRNDGWRVITPGEPVEGRIVGGNLCTINLLQGTRWMPDLDGAVLFLEDDFETHPDEFQRDLQSLLQQPGGDAVAGVVIGRFQRKTAMTGERLEHIVASTPNLSGVPVVADVDIGHTQPMATFPIGGEARIVADPDAPRITITRG